MENSQPLATESFSYSWLTQGQHHLSPTFRKNSNEYEASFNFDVPVVTSPGVHAEDIFADGLIKPAYDDRPKAKPLEASASVPASPLTLHPSRSLSLADRNHSYILRKWRKSSKKLLQDCFRFLRPLCKKTSRKSRRVDDLERKVTEVRSLSNSLEASPRPSSACSVVEWSDFEKNDDVLYHVVSPSGYSNLWCGDEDSINEAILYCKRSIEK